VCVVEINPMSVSVASNESFNGSVCMCIVIFVSVWVPYGLDIA
jgi:hypothetical protein